jgi:cysteinyl-tRNA synthetase, unknown class
MSRVCVTITRLALVALAAASVFGGAAQAERRPNALLNVKTWAYQLKDLSQEKIDKIAASPFDMVIIDASQFPEGSREIRLTRDQVAQMQKKPDGSRRLVIAYFSAGECEDFRYYWKPEWNAHKPSWVDKADKQWKGDYVVKYWMPEWQHIVFGSPTSLIDRIIDAGFDGLSIDRVDAYYYFGDTEQRRDQMVDFVKRMTNYMRSKKPDVVILAQNAEELLDRKDYVEVIDGIAKEDLIFGISHTEKRNPEGDIEHSTKLLEKARDAGKAIFVIEYLVNRDNIALSRKRMKEEGFVLYVGQRDLYELAGVVPDEGAEPIKPEKPAVADKPAKKTGKH